MGAKLLGFQSAEERIKRSHPDVEFLSGTGRKVKLIFKKSEYRAYIYNERYDEWEDMKLGGLRASGLQEYIQEKF